MSLERDSQAIEACLPQAAVLREPPVKLAEGFRPERVEAALSIRPHRDEARFVEIDLEPDSVLITLDLTPGIAVAESFIAALDHDRDGSLSTEEQRAYATLSAFRRGEGMISLTSSSSGMRTWLAIEYAVHADSPAGATGN